MARLLPRVVLGNNPAAWMWCFSITLLVIVHQQTHCEAVDIGGDVALLYSEVEDKEDAPGKALLLQLGASPKSVDHSVSSPSATGSGSGFNPGPLKVPYEKHMTANRDKWSQLGGWTKQHERKVELAKADTKRAMLYLKAKKYEKELAEMGCPCEGQKYHDLVFQNAGHLSQQPGFAMGSAAGSAATMHFGVKGKGKSQDASLSMAEFRRILKKYGKLGPNSSWQPKHEKKKGRARKALKQAEVKEHAAFITALPEFRRMKEEDPAFFTNGDCECPQGWTMQDAAALAAREAKDTEDSYWQALRLHRRNLADMTGESERLAKQEAKGEPPDDQMPSIEGPGEVQK